MRAEITTQAFFSQSNLALLPVKSDSASITNAYLPSTVPQWSPQSAITNHTIRDTRFDLMTLTESWSPGSAGNFELEGEKLCKVEIYAFLVTMNFPSVLVSREKTIWNQIKYYFVQLLSFLIGKFFLTV